MPRWQWIAPVAALAATGCVASKQDILLLQDEIRTLRAMQSREDTARRRQADSALMLMTRTNDSLRVLAQRFGAFQATVGGELFELGKQLITIQELAGMSSRRIMELRSTMEERAQAMTGTDTSARAATPARRGRPSSSRPRSTSCGEAATPRPEPASRSCCANIPASMRRRPRSFTSPSRMPRSGGPPRRTRCMGWLYGDTPDPRTHPRRCTSTGSHSSTREGPPPRVPRCSASSVSSPRARKPNWRGTDSVRSDNQVRRRAGVGPRGRTADGEESHR